MSDGGLSFDLDAPDLRGLLAGLKEVDAKLATNLRRELRQSGEDIIGAQRAVLANRPPRVAGSKRKLRLIKPTDGRLPYYAFRRTYQEGDPREGGVSQLREKISAGLRTRVQTGARRQGVQVKTTGPRNDGVNMARVWQSKQFRHPVFGDRKRFATQFGQDYFFGPVTDELRGRMRERVSAAVTDSLNAAAR